MNYCSAQGDKIKIMVMVESIPELVGVMKHVTINELRPVDYRGVAPTLRKIYLLRSGQSLSIKSNIAQPMSDMRCTQTERSVTSARVGSREIYSSRTPVVLSAQQPIVFCRQQLRRES
jgi:hypothetical protein